MSAKRPLLRLAALLMCLLLWGCASGADTAEAFYENLAKVAGQEGYALADTSEHAAGLSRDGVDCGASFLVTPRADGGIAEIAVSTLDFNAHQADFTMACALAVQAYVPKYAKDIDGARDAVARAASGTELTEKGASLLTEDGYEFSYDFIMASALLPLDAARFTVRALPAE